MKALPSLPQGFCSLSRPTPVSSWDKPGMGGFGFLHFAIYVANPDLPAALPPRADGEEPPNLLSGVV